MSGTDWDLLSSYGGLLCLATVSIYAGSFGSLPAFREGTARSDGEEEEEEDDIPDRLSSEDAWLFPIIGSITLGGLYLIIKYLGKEWINWLLGIYFSFTGAASVWKSSISLCRFVIGSSRWKTYERYSLQLRRGSHEVLTMSLRAPSLLLLPIAVIPSTLYSLTSAGRKSILLADILSMSLSHNALTLLKIDSFKTGCVLLSGLFLYDIWWVFGTRVMVTVATSLDVPIKLLWPKSLVFSDARGFTMLGLGDVVVPGTFIALALRYDFHRSGQPKSSLSFPKPYLRAALLAYVLGLVTTMAVMHVFGHAQPALLYLSPACILSFVFTAFRLGEFTEAWGWSDIPESKDKEGHMTAKKES